MTSDIVVIFGVLVGFEDVNLSCVGKLYSSTAAVIIAVAVAREIYDEILHGCCGIVLTDNSVVTKEIDGEDVIMSLLCSYSSF